jgi:GNAT superfamily N-acetyltransferase
MAHVNANIRAYQSRDQEHLEACILELQNFERTLEADRVEGAKMVARNLADLLTIVHENRGQIFVAEVTDSVIGFVSVRLEHEENLYTSTLTDYAYISDLVVLPSHRGEGYGAALLQKAEEFARQQGMTTLKIHVLVKNQQATAVYLHAGFRPYELALLKQLE